MANKAVLVVAAGVALGALAIFFAGRAVQERTAPPTSTAAADKPARTAPGSEAAPRPAAKRPVLEAPSFDVVRIDRGEAVIAGRAEPGDRVVVRDGEREIGETVASPDGAWVLLPKDPLAPGDHQLSLLAKGREGPPRQSERVVVVVVPEPHKDIAGRAAAQAGALALAVPRRGEGPSQVLQRPAPAAAAAAGPASAPKPASGAPSTKPALSLDVVDYGESGSLLLSGHGAPNAAVQVYLDNRLIGRARTDASGAWRLGSDAPVAPGVYTLRVDQLDGAGQVTQRVALPFARAAPGRALAGADKVVVQPGNNLWELARRNYGEGLRYTVIYQANKGQIRDPDLIYPGQVFQIPRTN